MAARITPPRQLPFEVLDRARIRGRQVHRMGPGSIILNGRAVKAGGPSVRSAADCGLSPHAHLAEAQHDVPAGRRPPKAHHRAEPCERQHLIEFALRLRA